MKDPNRDPRPAVQCELCGVWFRGSIHDHQRSLGCLVRENVRKALQRGYTRAGGYYMAFHQAGIDLRTWKTRISAGKLMPEFWAPRWAVEAATRGATLEELTQLRIQRNMLRGA